jgi:hypothetical protein
MRIIQDSNFQDIKIYRTIDGYTGEDGDWVEAGEQLIATMKADIQPKSGQERAHEVQTDYKSDYTLYVGLNDIEIPETSLAILGLTEFEDYVPLFERLQENGPHIFKQGDKIVDEYEKEYTLNFPGFWRTHYEMDLKAK